MILHDDQTHRVAQDWKVSLYYDRAEEEDWLGGFWRRKAKFPQLFAKLNTRVLVELACGHGRHTAYILANPRFADNVEQVYMIDINDENVSFCKERFRRMACARASGASKSSVQNENMACRVVTLEMSRVRPCLGRRAGFQSR
jgi:hypothetical protein